MAAMLTWQPPGRRARLLLILWYATAFVLLVMLPSLSVGIPPWQFNESLFLPLASLLCAFASAAVLLITCGCRPGADPVRLAMGVLVLFGLALATVVFNKLYLSRTMLLVHLPLSVILLLFPFFVQRLLVPIWVVMLLGTVFIAREALTSLGDSYQGASFTGEQEATTTLLPLKIHVSDLIVPKPGSTGGSLEPFGDGMILATGDGDLFHIVQRAGDGGFESRRLAGRVPANQDDFEHATGRDAGDVRFRTSDLLLEENGDLITLFAAYEYWLREEACLVVRVSETQTAHNDLLATDDRLTWRTVFQSSPCLDVMAEEQFWAGSMGGGRLARIDSSHILLTLGDFMSELTYKMDLEKTPILRAQDPESDYGKTILMDLEHGTSRRFTSGHRNPQGLFVSKDGTIYLTEHGPKGGDELNVLEESGNYGWPLVTLGTDYGELTWSLNKDTGSHDGYVRPLYAWVPSIGISNLIQLEQPLFKPWQGDLMVSSMAGGTLYRVRVRDGRVLYTEALRLDRRIRDIEEGSDGKIYLWIEPASLLVMEPRMEEHAP